MSDFAPMKELYLGCECMDLDHVALFIHFPPSEEYKKGSVDSVVDDDEDENIIYLSISAHNYYKDILPPIMYFYDKFAWQSFFAHNWYKRLWIAGRYIFGPSHRVKWGILDAFDFQDKDLEKMDAFLALISSDIDTSIDEKSEVWMDDEKWAVKFYPTRLEFEEHDYKGPWQVGWEPHFRQRGFWGRVGYAFKYIFGLHDPEKQFIIHERHAAKIRGMIKWVRETNKKDEKNDK